MTTPLLRLLFVEDDDYLRDAMAMLLEADGREIEVCGNAEAALECLAARPFHVVLTDISLPGMSGTELARRVLDEHPTTSVILSSGYPVDRLSSLIGPRCYALPKPFEPHELDALLERIRSASAG